MEYLTAVYPLRNDHPQALDTKRSTNKTEGVAVNNPSRRQRWPKGTWMKLTSPDTLAALMAQRGFSYDRLARYAGVSKGFISHLVKARKTTCRPETAERIAEALDVPLAILFVPSLSAGSGQIIRSGRAA